MHLYDPSTLTLTQTLPQSRGAQTFAIHTSISRPVVAPAAPSSSSSTTLDTSPDAPLPPQLVTSLLIGLKKRLISFQWTDGHANLAPTLPPLSLALPHTPRSIAFASPDRIVAAYTSADHVLIGINPLRVLSMELNLGSHRAGAGTEVEGRPNSVVSAGLGGLGLGGVGGYMTLGLGGSAKAKPRVIRVGEGEVLVDRDGKHPHHPLHLIFISMVSTSRVNSDASSSLFLSDSFWLVLWTGWKAKSKSRD